MKSNDQTVPSTSPERFPRSGERLTSGPCQAFLDMEEDGRFHPALLRLHRGGALVRFGPILQPFEGEDFHYEGACSCGLSC